MRALILLLASLLLAAPAAAQALYGPTVRTARSARALLQRMEAGPAPGESPLWFLTGTWHEPESGVRLVGSDGLEACDRRAIIPDTLWHRQLAAGARYAAAEHWKGARAELESIVFSAECVLGDPGSQELLLGGLTDLARAAWHGYPADEPLARRAMQTAIQMAPRRSWPHAGEPQLETAFLEERSRLIRARRAVVRVLDSGVPIIIDGVAQTGALELLPGAHVVRIGTASGVLTVTESQGILLGSPEALWSLISEDLAPGDTVAAFARAVLFRHQPGDYWLLIDGRAAQVDRSGALTWPSYPDRAVLRASLGYRFQSRTTQAPRVVSVAPTDHWLEPSLAVGFRARPRPAGPLVGLLGGASLILAGPIDLGPNGKRTRLIPAVRGGPTVAMAAGRVRLAGAVFAEAQFVGQQVVRHAEGGQLSTRATVFLGVVGELQVAARLTRVLWVTAQVGGGWVASPTATASVGLELRVGGR